MRLAVVEQVPQLLFCSLTAKLSFCNRMQTNASAWDVFLALSWLASKSMAKEIWMMITNCMTIKNPLIDNHLELNMFYKIKLWACPSPARFKDALLRPFRA